MPLKDPPTPGLVIICDRNAGFEEPEMVKERSAVVVSPRLPHRDGLCTVVPPSMAPSRSGIRHRCKVTLPIPASRPYDGTIRRAKADMLATVGFGRPNPPHTSRDPVSGQRRHRQIVVTPDDMKAIRSAILHALGLGRLTDHL